MIVLRKCGKTGAATVRIGCGSCHGKEPDRAFIGCDSHRKYSVFAAKDEERERRRPSPLISGEDLHDIALEGRGTLDGQSTYEWRLNNFTDYYILQNQRLMEQTGKPLLRPFPHGFADETIYPRMVLLLRCTDVRITGLKFVRSRSWTINPLCLQASSD